MSIINLPIFTTSSPGFMCDTSDYNKEIVEQLKGEQGFIGFAGKPWITAYFHGALEDELGYDIPIWLKGDILNVPKQKVLVYTRDADDVWLAIMHIEKREHPGVPEGFNQHYKGVITFPNEAREDLEWLR